MAKVIFPKPNPTHSPIAVDPLVHVVHVANAALISIQECFKPGAKITLIVRRPGAPTQDFCMTTDDDRDALKACVDRMRMQGEPAEKVDDDAS